MPTSTVVSLHIALASRLPMKTLDSVVVEGGAGLVGDRYHGSRHRHVSVQSTTQLLAAAEILGASIEPGHTRRNVTIAEGEIPMKPGTLITIGSVELEVVRVAAPCTLLDDVIGRGARKALSKKAGSICRALTGGEIAVGDQVSWREVPR